MVGFEPNINVGFTRFTRLRVAFRVAYPQDGTIFLKSRRLIMGHFLDGKIFHEYCISELHML